MTNTSNKMIDGQGMAFYISVLSILLVVMTSIYFYNELKKIKQSFKSIVEFKSQLSFYDKEIDQLKNGRTKLEENVNKLVRMAILRKQPHLVVPSQQEINQMQHTQHTQHTQDSEVRQDKEQEYQEYQEQQEEELLLEKKSK